MRSCSYGHGMDTDRKGFASLTIAGRAVNMGGSVYDLQMASTHLHSGVGIRCCSEWKALLKRAGIVIVAHPSSFLGDGIITSIHVQFLRAFPRPTSTCARTPTTAPVFSRTPQRCGPRRSRGSRRRPRP